MRWRYFSDTPNSFDTSACVRAFRACSSATYRDHISGVLMFPAAKVMAPEFFDCQSGEFAPSPVKGQFAAAAFPVIALSVEAIRQLVQ